MSKANCSTSAAAEAMSMRIHRKSDENEFVKEIAAIYCAKPRKGDEQNLWDMLTTIYEYGRVIGIRSERNRRKGGVSA